MIHIKKIGCLFAMLVMVSIVGAQNGHLEKEIEQQDISKTWRQFVEAVASNDKVKFKELASDSIKCYDCLENTDSEREILNELRENDSTWYERIYNDMIYIPAADFIAEDFDLIFTPEFVKIMSDKKPIFVQHELDGALLHEVLITTIEPSDDFEGVQHAFQFKQVDGMWKFNQLSTIP